MEQKEQGFLKQMQQSYEGMTGMRLEDASDIGIRFQILAAQLERLYREVSEAKKQSFAQTATGEYLEKHAMQRGITRKPALYAKGTAEFFREQAQGELEIAAGTVLTTANQSENPMRFETTERAVMKVGETKVLVPVQCREPGKKGNLAAGLLTVMVTPAAGIARVNNPKPIVGGEDEEGDEELRERLTACFRMVTNGTNEAFYYHKAMEYPEVRSAKVLPRVNGAGSVAVLVWGEGVNENLLRRMKEEIGAIKEINVDLTVERATEKPTEIQMQIAVKDGYGYEDIEKVCRQAIERLLGQGQIGAPLYTARLSGELLRCEGVENCRIVAPSEDIFPSKREIVTLSKLTVSQMSR